MPGPAKEFMMLEDASSPALSTWSAERSALVADALHRSGYLRLRVRGESMLPALWPGDVVEIASCSLEEIKPGEIALALRDGRLFLHRFVSCTPNGFKLCGDSMPGADPWFTPAELLGRLVRVRARAHPHTRARHEERTIPRGALSRAVGLMFCYSGVARRVALKLHSRRTSSREYQSLGAL
jgi:Peptidase S24-like